MAKRKTESEREKEISRRHARLARERADELVRNPTRDVPGLTQQMKAMGDYLDGLPEGREFDCESLDALDDCRIECFRLKTTIEAILEDLQGS